MHSVRFRLPPKWIRVNAYSVCSDGFQCFLLLRLVFLAQETGACLDAVLIHFGGSRIRKKYTEELKNRNEIKRFIDSQLACWPLAHHNHEALQTIQTKELSINGYTFVVQCNAQRAVSTTAKVDKG